MPGLTCSLKALFSNRKIFISKFIIILICTRIIFDQFWGLTHFFYLFDYNVSIQTCFTMVIIILIFLRLPFDPKNPYLIRIIIIIFLLYITVFGLFRMFSPDIIIKDYSSIIFFTVCILVSPKLIRDLSIEYITKLVLISTIILLIFHSTAWLWSPRDVYADLKNYIGAFGNYHIAAITFKCLFPFVFLSCISRERGFQSHKILNYILLGMLTFFLIFTFQRTAIISIIIFLILFLSLTRKYKETLIPFVFIIGSFIIIPQANLDYFLERKLHGEVISLSAEDKSFFGYGRMGLINYGTDKFLNDFSVAEKIFGRGAGQSYIVHMDVIGNLENAHIQLLMIVYDYGVLGLILLIIFFAVLWYYKLKLWKNDKSPENAIGICIFSIICLELLYSMPIQQGGSMILLLLWLYCRNPFIKDESTISLQR